MEYLSTDENHPAQQISDLCRLFYTQDWVPGTGGGMSIRDRERDLVYLAPSGVEKEKMKYTDMFVMDLKTQEYVRKPENYKPSACTPLFLSAYTKRDAGACIHTHSRSAVMASLLFDKEFRIANIEQIKGVPKVTEPGNLGFFDTLVIPIIENTAHEEDLTPDLEKALEEYPSCTAVLVRRHGIYVWGNSVAKAKVINECIHYLLDLAIQMKQFGLDPAGAIGSEKHHR